MFESQLEHLKSRYRCIAFDHRGQGQSPVTEGGYDTDSLTDDAIRLIESQDAGPCHFVGLSMGGMVAMRIAIKRPDLLKSVVLISTTPEATPDDVRKGYSVLAFLGRWFGFGVLSKKIAPMMFGKDFMDDPARADECARWTKAIGSNSRKGASRTIKALGDSQDISAGLANIDMPVLYIAGAQEAALPKGVAEATQAKISGCQLVTIPKAGHSSTIEQPEAVNAALDAFYAGQS